MTEKELTELKELLDTVTPLTWADHAGKIWNAAPALITAAEREAKLRKAAVEFLAVAAFVWMILVSQPTIGPLNLFWRGASGHA